MISQDCQEVSGQEDKEGSKVDTRAATSRAFADCRVRVVTFPLDVQVWLLVS